MRTFTTINSSCCLISVMVLLVCGAAATAADDLAAADLVVDRFEKTSYHGWTATGEAFLRGPAIGRELLNRLEIENTSDHCLASSEIDGDQAQGTLTSDSFQIKRNYIGFRIGGGRYEQSTGEWQSRP